MSDAGCASHGKQTRTNYARGQQDLRSQAASVAPPGSNPWPCKSPSREARARTRRASLEELLPRRALLANLANPRLGLRGQAGQEPGAQTPVPQKGPPSTTQGTFVARPWQPRSDRPVPSALSAAPRARPRGTQQVRACPRACCLLLLLHSLRPSYHSRIRSRVPSPSSPARCPSARRGPASGPHVPRPDPNLTHAPTAARTGRIRTNERAGRGGGGGGGGDEASDAGRRTARERKGLAARAAN